MAEDKDSAPFTDQVKLLRSFGWVFLSFPPIVAFLAPFAQTTRGVLIGLLSFLPLILFVPVWTKMRDPAKFRPSMAAGLLLETNLATGLAFVLLPIAYLSPSDPLLWRLLFLQTTLIGAGFLAGLIKHDAEKLRRNQRARHMVQPGHVLIRKRPGAIYGFRQATGSLLFDWGARAVYAAYATVILIGAVFGGAASIVLLRLIGLKPGVGLDAHMTGMTLLGLLVLPFVGYILPALYRTWIGLRRIERAAGYPRSQVIYSWEP